MAPYSATGRFGRRTELWPRQPPITAARKAAQWASYQLGLDPSTEVLMRSSAPLLVVALVVAAAAPAAARDDSERGYSPAALADKREECTVKGHMSEICL